MTHLTFEHRLASVTAALFVLLLALPSLGRADDVTAAWYLSVDAAQERFDEHAASSESGGMAHHQELIVRVLDESEVPYDVVNCRARWCVIEGSSAVPEFERTWIAAEVALIDRLGGFEAFCVNDHARQRWVMMVDQPTR